MKIKPTIQINPIPKPEYVGLTMDQIIAEHSDYQVIPIHRNKKEMLLVEIRLENATLTCVIDEQNCVEAYLFSD